MRIPQTRRLAPWGGALALFLSPAWAPAQDGKVPTEPPVTNPRTDSGGTTTGPKTTADVLPGVPETARDPAPPGTRGVRVDVPKGAAKTKAAPAKGTRATPGLMVAEGVVTRIDKPGKAVQGELIRFAFDPSQDWASYVNRGATGIADDDAPRPKTKDEVKDANAKQHADNPDAPKVLEMVISTRSYLYTYARSADGMDMYGATTASSPDKDSSLNGEIRRPASAPATAPSATNFTNIKEGSYVSVRYRKVGDLNQVLNLSLIEFPLDDAGPASPTTAGGTTPAAGGRPATGTGTTPARVPTVPSAPIGGELPR